MALLSKENSYQKARAPWLAVFRSWGAAARPVWTSHLFRVILAGMLMHVAPEYAVAGDDGGDVAVRSVAPPVCAFFSSPSVRTQNNMSLDSAGTGSSAIRVDDLLDQNTAKLKRASVHLSLAGVCNASHYVALTSVRGGLFPKAETTVAGGTFLKQVNYRASVSWGPQSITLIADGTAGKTANSSSYSAPYFGSLEIDISIDETNNPFDIPVAAQIYSDTLIVKIGTSY